MSLNLINDSLNEGEYLNQLGSKIDIWDVVP
jgi:hypothetical protein